MGIVDFHQSAMDYPVHQNADHVFVWYHLDVHWNGSCLILFHAISDIQTQEICLERKKKKVILT